MPLHAALDDITTMQVDCIVNAAKRTLMGGGGVDGAIHRAAGPELLAECKRLKGNRLTACELGQAVLTAGYNLPAQYVIHTVGPVWQGGEKGEAEILASCYRNSLSVFAGLDCKSIAFPAISCGVYGYPKAEAATVAVRECQNFLHHHPEQEVYLVTVDEETFSLFENAITLG